MITAKQAKKLKVGDEVIVDFGTEIRHRWYADKKAATVASVSTLPSGGTKIVFSACDGDSSTLIVD